MDVYDFKLLLDFFVCEAKQRFSCGEGVNFCVCFIVVLTFLSVLCMLSSVSLFFWLQRRIISLQLYINKNAKS